jgi:hypothetical protein
MNLTWFRTWGWLFRPVSVAGCLALSLAILFCIQVFVLIDRHSHSVGDTVYGVFPYFVCGFLLLDWLATKTSDN